jgi:hypothetical protein
MSPAEALRAARIAAGAAAGAAAGLAIVSFLGGLSSGAIGGLANPDKFSGSSVNFPEELFENDHYIEFTAKQTRGVAEDALGSSLGISLGSTTLGGTIRLPMPSNLSTDYNPEYSTPNLGSAAGMALKPSDQAIYGNPTMGNQAMVGNSLQGLINALGGGVVGAATDYGLGKINELAGKIGGGEGTAGAILKVAGGIAQNPHKIVLFTGVNFREHHFSWKLSPKNRKESNAIKQIIDMFTYYSHPEYIAGGLFFKYPEFFEIKFRHPEYLFNLQPSVCKDVRVNFHGQGYPAYIRDWNGGGAPAPAEVELSLSFMETEIVTKQSLNGVLKTPPPPPPPPRPLPQVDPMGNVTGF